MVVEEKHVGEMGGGKVVEMGTGAGLEGAGERDGIGMDGLGRNGKECNVHDSRWWIGESVRC